MRRSIHRLIVLTLGLGPTMPGGGGNGFVMTTLLTVASELRALPNSRISPALVSTVNPSGVCPPEKFRTARIREKESRSVRYSVPSAP
jgi:hypothetical protein